MMGMWLRTSTGVLARSPFNHSNLFVVQAGLVTVPVRGVVAIQDHEVPAALVEAVVRLFQREHLAGPLLTELQLRRKLRPIAPTPHVVVPDGVPNRRLKVRLQNALEMSHCF